MNKKSVKSLKPYAIGHVIMNVMNVVNLDTSMHRRMLCNLFFSFLLVVSFTMRYFGCMPFKWRIEWYSSYVVFSRFETNLHLHILIKIMMIIVLITAQPAL